MNKSFTEIIMNPVRQRIMQYLLIHKKGTVSEISQELSDIPRPSLYRHIKTLFDNNCIEIVAETKIRGTVEKTYSMVEHPLGKELDNQEVSLIIQSSLFSIMDSFTRYFANATPDPQKDMLSLSTSTIMLSDEEMMEFFSEIGEVYNKVLQNKPDGKRKPRSITIISAPCEQNEKE